MVNKFSHFFPHHTRTESWILKLIDEGLDDPVFLVFLFSKESLFERSEKRQSLDPLSSPVGTDFTTWNTPDLLRIGLEKNIVETLSESIAHPLLECSRGPFRKKMAIDVAQEDQNTIPNTESKKGVHRAQWIVKKLVVVIDSRETPAYCEISFAEDLFPHLVHSFDFGEETVPSNIE